jgi:thymidylate synthase (FAD)
MRLVEPQVFLIGRSVPDYEAFEEYLDTIGATDSDVGEPMFGRDLTNPEDLAEFAGRLCYRSWKPGLNKNVTKVRTGHDEYLRNILRSRHGSVLEHVSYSFVFHNVSRVFTHELCRHRPGVAISQESMRFVRLTDLPMWIPDWALAGDEEAQQQVAIFLERAEWLQKWLARRFGLDSMPFAAKKRLTSFMRRFAPEGVATGIMWTANVRALRHVIEARTAAGAEEEIRLVFSEVAKIMRAEAPALFRDFTQAADGSWVPEWSKV